MLAAATWLSNSIAKTQAALSEVSSLLEVGGQSDPPTQPPGETVWESAWGTPKWAPSHLCTDPCKKINIR